MAIELFPAVDMIAGQVVRLYQGRRDAMDVYSDDPAAMAGSFQEQGARWVHVVDLSAAFGEDLAARRSNEAAIRDICTIPGLSVDVGGGVRSLRRVEELLDLGCARVAMGTPLVRDPAMAQEAASTFGDVLVADVAAKDSMVRVDGWREGTSLQLDNFLHTVAAWGFKHLVYTDVAKDGTGDGIAEKAYGEAAGAVGFPVVASGGVASLDDIARLKALGPEVLEGIIVGRALYEGAFTVAEALAVLGEE